MTQDTEGMRALCTPDSEAHFGDEAHIRLGEMMDEVERLYASFSLHAFWRQGFAADWPPYGRARSIASF